MIEKSLSGLENQRNTNKRVSSFSRLLTNEIKPILTEPKRLKSLVGVGIATLGIGREACALTETNNKTDSPTIINLRGEMSSQKNDLGIDLKTNEVLGFTLDQVRDTILNGPESIPLSIEKIEVLKNAFEKWKQKTYGPIEAEMRAIEGHQEKRVSGCAKVMLCHRNSGQFGLDKFQNYISETDIINYLKGGKNEDVICDEKGNMMVWMVVADKNMKKRAKKGFNDALKWYKSNKMPDVLECALENGMSVLFVANTHPDRGSGSSWLNQFGLISVNQNSENTKGKNDKLIRNQYIAALYVEPYGVKLYHVSNALRLFDGEEGGMAKELGYVEVIKSLMAGYVGEELRGVDKDGRFAMYADNFMEAAKDFAHGYERYGVTVDSPLTKRLIQVMSNFIAIPGFGNLKEIPAYNKAMENW